MNKAIYGLHQAPIKFKQELIQWFQEQQYTPANEAKTIWIKRVNDKLIIHALYADDFLHFTNSSSLYQQFQKLSNQNLISKLDMCSFTLEIK